MVKVFGGFSAPLTFKTILGNSKIKITTYFRGEFRTQSNIGDEDFLWK